MHWFVLHRKEKTYHELFDSLGSTATFVRKYFQNQKGLFDFNVTRFQSNESVKCGQFCVFFIVERYFNQDIEFADLLEEIFTENVEENEKRVEDFFSQYVTS